ncbi:MAG: T9SS type A sorting domain-containing protein [Candidatus Krumholzibacteriaceae bacterium]|jgi:hypothetical protein
MKAALQTSTVFLLLSCLCASVSHAGWIQNGVPLAPQWNSMGIAQAAPDGFSGLIVAYDACYLGTTHVIAHRTDASGAPLWPSAGIVVGTGSSPAVASDGSGGAIIAWQDNRGAGLDIFAQRLDASGTPQWAENGIAVCTAAGDQSTVLMTPDGAGGAYIVWLDGRAGSSDIYAQRVDGSGAARWTTNGVAVCSATGEQSFAQLGRTGSGALLVAWQDFRAGGTDSSSVYAQKLDPSGAVQWAADGVAVCSTPAFRYPQIVSDGAEGAIVAWCDARNWLKVYARRIDASGTVQWPVDGVPLCTAPSDQERPQMVSDGAGGAIVIWWDLRPPFPNARICGQRVDPSGALLWPAEGIAFCMEEGNQDAPLITSDGAGGAIVVWRDTRGGGYDIYAQHANASGAIQWIPEGVVVSTETQEQSPGLVSDGAGGAIVTHQGYFWGPLFAQRISGSGELEWANGGAVIGPQASGQNYAQIAADEAGGAIAAWTDYRNAGPDYQNTDIYAQRVDASGNVRWSSAGLSICSAPGGQLLPAVISDGSGGAVVAWYDGRSQVSDINAEPAIYAQRVDASGAIRWAADGVPIRGISAPASVTPSIVSDGSGGAIISWLGRGGSYDFDVYAQRVDASGAMRWGASGVAVCTAPGYQTGIAMSPDGGGGAYIAWQDGRNGGSAIYAQRLNAAGVAQWQTNGSPICTAQGDRSAPLIAVDETGTAITIAWVDYRSGNADFYGQRLDPSGAAQWNTNGTALVAAGAAQGDFQIVSDGEAGAIVTWVDSGNLGNWNIFARHVNPVGAAEWTTALVVNRPYGGTSVELSVVPDGAGGEVAEWSEYRDGTELDVYAQRVNAAGLLRWPSGGVAVSAVEGTQWHGRMVSDGTGGAIVSWSDLRCPNPLIYAQRVTGPGDFVATLLQSYSAEAEGRSVRVSWTLSTSDENLSFVVLRAAVPGGTFERLGGKRVEGQGLSFSFTDETCLPGSTYIYRVEYSKAGDGTAILFETGRVTTPRLPMTLYQNVPNPFNPSTVIRFYLPEKGPATLDIYDVAGKRVARLVEGTMGIGYHQIGWDGRNGDGTACASGVYFCRLKAGGKSVTNKIVIAR